MSWARALSALYAIALVTAFQFEPTNATMVACHSGFVVLWMSNFAMVFVVVSMVHVIFSHAKQTVRVSDDRGFPRVCCDLLIHLRSRAGLSVPLTPRERGVGCLMGEVII